MAANVIVMVITLWLNKHVKENKNSVSKYLLRYSLLITNPKSCRIVDLAVFSQIAILSSRNASVLEKVSWSVLRELALDIIWISLLGKWYSTFKIWSNIESYALKDKISCKILYVNDRSNYIIVILLRYRPGSLYL